MCAAAKKVIVIGNAEKTNVRETVDRALAVLKGKAEITALDLDGEETLENVPADIVFVFGGDGAILKAVRRLGRNQLPVCGVNLGKVGFLATLTDSDLAHDPVRCFGASSRSCRP